MRQLAKVALIALVSLSCVQRDTTLADAAQPRPQHREGEVRSLSPRPIDAAVQHVSALASSASEEHRRALVGIYEQAGYVGAAYFFDNTLPEKQGDEVVTTPPRGGSWSGGPGEVDERAYGIAQRAAHLISEGKYRDALDLIHEEGEQNGMTMQLSMEWAHATLALAVEAPAEISSGAREVAVRLILTSLEERAPRPLGIELKAGGYSLLARAFLQQSDKLSARTAARLALVDLRGQPPSPWRTASEQRLREVIRRTQ